MDQFMFFLPFYAMVSILAGVGLAAMAAHGKRRWLAAAATLSLAVTVAIYALAPQIWLGLALPLPGRKDLPFRDAARYWLQPWKMNEDSAGRFARTALENVPPGSVILADGTSLYPILWVQETEGLRPDVRAMRIGRATPENLPIGTPNVFSVTKLPPRLNSLAFIEGEKQWQVLYPVGWRDGAGKAGAR